MLYIPVHLIGTDRDRAGIGKHCGERTGRGTARLVVDEMPIARCTRARRADVRRVYVRSQGPDPYQRARSQDDERNGQEDFTIHPYPLPAFNSSSFANPCTRNGTAVRSRGQPRKCRDSVLNTPKL